MMPTQWSPARDVEMASTVWAVFRDFERDVEYRHGSPERFRSPNLPVVGQWHLRVLFPALIVMMKRLGLEMILPRLRGRENLNIGLGNDDFLFVSNRAIMESLAV